jgi:hypothetical protein
MHCNQCGGQYIARQGDLELNDPYVGPFTVEAVEYLECGGCGDLAYSPKTMKKIEKARRSRLENELQSLPLRDFISAAEAASMLGISRQALHKHRRIRRGFIFQTQFSDKTVYLKKSVELFRDTGDGRFQLVRPENDIGYTPERITTPVVLYILTAAGGRRTRYVR